MGQGDRRVMAEISVIPLGTATPSVGEQVAAALRALVAFPEVEHELTAMGTTLVGDRGAVLAACEGMHAAVLAAGARRCYTIIKLDERTDKAMDAREKVVSLRRRLGERRES